MLFLGCWMHMQGRVLANTVLDTFSGCWMGCWMPCFDCFIQHLFGWCWMGVGSVNIRIKITWCWAGIGWTNIQISGKIQLGKYWMQSVGQNTSTFAGMHLFA